MAQGDVIISFDRVSFGYDPLKPLLDEVEFSIRERAKFTIMGQNGAGKSTLFKLIAGQLKPQSGRINIRDDAKIATSLQVVPRDKLNVTVQEFFAGAFKDVPRDLERRITSVLETVNLVAPLTKKMNEFSGGQQARLLLAYGLIQEPDILLLDEPTNNLDPTGIWHLTEFLINYPKTCIVISHDANFLNMFTDGVLHLDVFSRKVTKYLGDYYSAVDAIEAQIERDRRQNARLEKEIQDNKDKVNFFANKGGKMRKLASKLRDSIEEAEENKAEVRREEKTLGHFTIPFQDFPDAIVTINSVTFLKDHTPVTKPVDIQLRKRQRLLLEGSNGIGKSTLLEALARGTQAGAKINPEVKVGYYRQDFSGLNFDATVRESLEEMDPAADNETIYRTAARFLITSDLLKNKVGSLSEGQKGLLCFARFTLQQPGLLILDEPTNHINFRHIPVIAQAIQDYEGAVVLVSHVPEFVEQIKFTETLDLGKL
ncbi:MAG TPA: ATP-binding cassette domain-containing protein [Patescibacteria group bacterium]